MGFAQKQIFLLGFSDYTLKFSIECTISKFGGAWIKIYQITIFLLDPKENSRDFMRWVLLKSKFFAGFLRLDTKIFKKMQTI